MMTHLTDPGIESRNAELPGSVSSLTSLTQNVSSDGTRNAFSNVDTADWTKVILQHPTACKASLLDTYNVVWDSGVSLCNSNNKYDFLNSIQPLTNARVDGITSHLQLEWVGKVCWSMFDSVGNMCDMILPTDYAPKAWQKLHSTTISCKNHPNNVVILNPKSWTIQPDLNQLLQHAIEQPINDSLPLVWKSQQAWIKLLWTCYYHTCTNINLSELHKELLWWHYCQGHIRLCMVQFVMCTSSALAISHAIQGLHKWAANIPSHDLPKYAAYQFGKQIKQSIPGKWTQVIQEHSGLLSAEKPQPG